MKSNAVEPDEASDEAKKDQLVLFKRIADVRALERRNGVEDIMYTSIIQKFLGVGVDMLPPLDERRHCGRGFKSSHRRRAQSRGVGHGA